VAASCWKKARRLIQKHDDFVSTLEEHHLKDFKTYKEMKEIYDGTP
jgi:hypothetical protein